jgi:hypothetical protein
VPNEAGDCAGRSADAKIVFSEVETATEGRLNPENNAFLARCAIGRRRELNAALDERRRARAFSRPAAQVARPRGLRKAIEELTRRARPEPSVPIGGSDATEAEHAAGARSSAYQLGSGLSSTWRGRCAKSDRRAGVSLLYAQAIDDFFASTQRFLAASVMRCRPSRMEMALALAVLFPICSPTLFLPGGYAFPSSGAHHAFPSRRSIRQG